MTAQQQQALDSFYALDNVITIKIKMPQSEWDAVRNEEPAGGRCNFDFAGGSRYTWRKATSVEISGTRFPASGHVRRRGRQEEIILRIHQQRQAVPAHRLRQVRQCQRPRDRSPDRVALRDAQQLHSGQVLYQADTGLQAAGHGRVAPLAMQLRPGVRQRNLIGQGVAGVNSPGIYVNAEPIMKRYIERNFNGNMKGNLYEIEHTDDLVEARLNFIGVESLSKFDDKADLKFACRHIKANGLAGADQMLDIDQFLKIYAMEFLLKHWDGYADNTNNTYLYNDVTAVATPGVGNIKFKMIPWGIDQTLQPRRPFKLGRDGVIAQLVRNDDTRRKQLIDQIRLYRETLFSREKQQTVLKPLIDQMQRLLTGFGVPNLVAEIDRAAAIPAGRIGRIYFCRPAWRLQPGLYPQA